MAISIAIAAPRPASARLGAAAAPRRPAASGNRTQPRVAASYGYGSPAGASSTYKPYWEQDNWGMSDDEGDREESSSYGNGHAYADTNNYADGDSYAGANGYADSNGYAYGDTYTEANGYADDANGYADSYANGYSNGYDAYGQEEHAYEEDPGHDGHESYEEDAWEEEAQHSQRGSGGPVGQADVQDAIASNPLFTSQFMSVLQNSLARQGSSALTSAPPAEPRVSASEEVLAAALSQSRQQMRQLLAWREQLEQHIAAQQKQIERIDFALTKTRGDAAYMRTLKEMLEQDE